MIIKNDGWIQEYTLQSIYGKLMEHEETLSQKVNNMKLMVMKEETNEALMATTIVGMKSTKTANSEDDTSDDTN